MPKNPPLTKHKQKWAANRSVKLKGTALPYNISQQRRYARAITKLVKVMTDETKSKIMKLYNSRVGEEYFAEDASIGSAARILMNALTKKFTLLFAGKAKSLAETMFKGTLTTSESALGMSLKQLSGGITLKTGVVPAALEEKSKTIIAENVNLIVSIPEQYMKDISGEVYRSITTGMGLADLVPALSKYTGAVNRRTKLLALDQTRKAYVAVNAERMKAVGVKKFEWNHSGGSAHPRETHLRIFDGKVFPVDAAGCVAEQRRLGVTDERDLGLPGFPINCRCDMIPVIDLDSED